jgi:predicted nucleic acid-binding protein
LGLRDERKARPIAEDNGTIIVGTIGIIERVAKKNLVNIKAASAALKKISCEGRAL